MTRKVTIRDIADGAGVSISSVSLYLNDKPGLSDATRKRIGSVAKRLGYTPRDSKPCKANPSLIGLIVEKLSSPIFSDLFYGVVVQGMEREARELGYNLALSVLEPDKVSDHFVADHFHNEIAGMVILGGGDIPTEKVIDTVLDEELPIMLVDVHVPALPVDCVLADNISGAYRINQYLIQHGYRDIACIQGPSKYPSLVERFQGYCNALIAAGLTLNPATVIEGLSEGLPEKGYRETKTLLARDEPFDAIFCVSDRTAFGALRALQEAGLRVPDDIALVGFDNVAQSEHTSPPLTTVNVPRDAMGSLAVRRLHQLIKGEAFPEPTKSVLNTSPVIRESTR